MLSLPEHIEALLAFNVNVSIKAHISVLSCYNFLVRLIKYKLYFISMYFEYYHRKSSLHYACENGKIEVAECLMKHEAQNRMQSNVSDAS